MVVHAGQPCCTCHSGRDASQENVAVPPPDFIYIYIYYIYTLYIHYIMYINNINNIYFTVGARHVQQRLEPVSGNQATIELGERFLPYSSLVQTHICAKSGSLQH